MSENAVVVRIQFQGIGLPVAVGITRFRTVLYAVVVRVWIARGRSHSQLVAV